MWNVNNQPIYAILYSLIYIIPTIVLVIFYKYLKRRDALSEKTKFIIISICFAWYLAAILGIYITKYYDSILSRTEEVALNYGLIIFLILQIIVTTILISSIKNIKIFKRVMLCVFLQLSLVVVCFVSLNVANKYGREVMFIDDSCSGFSEINCMYYQ